MSEIRAVIAEDDFRVLRIQEQFLEKIDDVSVIGKALNAQETLQVLEENEVDLLLLDIYMPDQLGIDLIPDIRKKFPNVDIIIISAATDKEFLEACLRNGVFSYLIKPVSLEKFTEVIQAYKEQYSQIQSKEEFDQAFADKMFGLKKQESNSVPHEDLPKGVDPLTLEKVMDVLHQNKDGLTADSVAQQMGASRTTARRYLEYLISVNKVNAELEYGVVGRPERIYSTK